MNPLDWYKLGGTISLNTYSYEDYKNRDIKEFKSITCVPHRKYNGEMCQLLNDEEYKELEEFMKQYELEL